MRVMWDIFCRVIDNHGDVGVCLRLSRQLAQRGQRVRLWLDRPEALSFMAPELLLGNMPGVELKAWSDATLAERLAELPLAQVWIEAFGCQLPDAFVAHGAQLAARWGATPPVWINLEYLSAETFYQRVHGLPSPVQSGPAKGWSKVFYCPGFSLQSGGLLREPGLLEAQTRFDRKSWRARYLAQDADHGRLISLFCYQPAALTEVLSQMKRGDRLLVPPGPALDAMQAIALADQNCDWQALPYTDQAGFDRMLWACDLNFVRGEDSLVRALWAGQPLVWQIYPQHDAAHHAKLEAFLDWLAAPSSMCRFHRVWNGSEAGRLPILNEAMWHEWAECVRSARQRLLVQDDLLSQLMGMTGMGHTL